MRSCQIKEKVSHRIAVSEMIVPRPSLRHTSSVTSVSRPSSFSCRLRNLFICSLSLRFVSYSVSDRNEYTIRCGSIIIGPPRRHFSFFPRKNAFGVILTEEFVNFITDNLQSIFSILIIFLLTVIAAQIAGIWMNRTVRRVKDKSQSGSTKLVMLKHMIVGVIYGIGFLIILYSVPSLRSFSTTLLASAGLATVVLGLAAQDTFGNIISGLAIVLFQPFNIGDMVTVEDTYGEVIDISLRHTTIETFDKRHIIIPNSSLNKLTVTNWTGRGEHVIWTLVMQISYGSDVERAREIMMEEARKSPYVMKTEEVRTLFGEDNLPDIKVRMIGLGAYTVDLRLDFWVYTRRDAFSAECAIREAVKNRFEAEPNVNIPFPHTTVLF